MGEMEDKEVKDTIDAYKNGRPMPNKLKTAGKIGTTPAYANNSVKSSKVRTLTHAQEIVNMSKS